MKKIISAVLMFFAFNASAQVPEIIWQQCYGTADFDYASGIAPTENGYMLAVEVQSGEGLTNYHGSYDIWIVNIDSNGTLLWEKCVGGSGYDSPQKIISIGNNEFYVFGMTGSTDGDVQSYNQGNGDLWVVKINGEGDLLWEKCYGSWGTDEPRDMILTADGGFAMLARISTSGGDISNYGSYDNWIVKCDSLGNIEWEITLGNNGLDNGISMMINSAGNIMMLGAAQWHGGLVECYPDGAWADVWIVELDLQGNILSQHCYGGSHYDLGNNLIELEDGYIFNAYTHSNDGDVSGLHGPIGLADDIWVVRLNEQMEIVWQKCLGGYDYDTPSYITQTSDDGFIVIGYTVSNDGDVSGNHSHSGTNADIWVVKLNESGDIEWQRCYGGVSSQRLENPYTILKKSDYNYVIAASTEGSPTYDVQCGTFESNNAWIFEIALPDTVGVITATASANEIKVYPNPATTELWLQLPENTPIVQARIELYSPAGKLLHKTKPSSHFHKIDVAHLPKGLYLVRLWDGERWYVEKLVVR
jgi:hypothetical protein